MTDTAEDATPDDEARELAVAEDAVEEVAPDDEGGRDEETLTTEEEPDRDEDCTSELADEVALLVDVPAREDAPEDADAARDVAALVVPWEEGMAMLEERGEEEEVTTWPLDVPPMSPASPVSPQWLAAQCPLGQV